MESGKQSGASEKGSSCEICQLNAASSLCNQCKQKYCSTCVNKHNRVNKAKPHDVVPYQESCKPNCEICEQNESTKFCQECDQHICLSCAVEHGRFAITKSHILRDLDDSSNSICQRCTTQSATKYCDDCAEHMCDDCTAKHNRMGISKDHRVKDRSNKAKSTNEFNSEKRSQDCKTNASEKNELLEFIDKMKKLGVICLPAGTSLKRLRKDLKAIRYYAFFFRFNQERFLESKNMFLSLAENIGPAISKSDVKESSEAKIYFFAIDLNECDTSQLIDESFVTEANNIISLYEVDRYTITDYLEHIEEHNKLPFIKFNGKPKSLKTNPIERAFLIMHCPNKCQGVDLKWLCFDCQEPVQYHIINDQLFCNCGIWEQAPYGFRCGSGKHDFVDIAHYQLQRTFKALPNVKEVNILILGQTGVGKSTWINAVANYLTSDTLAEAATPNNFMCLIPTTFKLFTEDNEEKVIKIGQVNDSEVLSTKGESATQDTKSYLFPSGELNIRLIDTPGIGDTRGLSVDRQNCEQILQYLANAKFKMLHGICILLKGNQARLTNEFVFCVTELLKQLHVSATKNIIFCFTNSRISNYRPGDSITPLQELLKIVNRSRSVTISLTENLYCLDNEPFRYLCGVQSGFKFSQEEVAENERSWKKSKEQTSKMMYSLLKRPPYAIKNSVSINEARNLATMLLKPMNDLNKLLEQNRIEMEKKKKELEQMGGKQTAAGSLSYRLEHKVKQKRIKTTPLDTPMSVCDMCKEQVTDTKTNETRISHRVCEAIPGPWTRLWRAFYRGICSECGCSREKHFEMTYKIEEEEYEETVQSTKQLDDIITEIETRQHRVTEITAIFIQFLQVNALVAVNDAALEYIEREERLIQDKEVSKDYTKEKKSEALVTLKKMKNKYEKEKQQIDGISDILEPIEREIKQISGKPKMDNTFDEQTMDDTFSNETNSEVLKTLKRVKNDFLSQTKTAKPSNERERKNLYLDMAIDVTQKEEKSANNKPITSTYTKECRIKILNALQRISQEYSNKKLKAESANCNQDLQSYNDPDEILKLRDELLQIPRIGPELQAMFYASANARAKAMPDTDSVLGRVESDPFKLSIYKKFKHFVRGVPKGILDWLSSSVYGPEENPGIEPASGINLTYRNKM